MEGRNRSTSSFTSDLFGDKNNSSSSATFLKFSNPALEGAESHSLNASETEKKHDTLSQALSAKNRVSEKDVSNGGVLNQNKTNKAMNPYHLDQKDHPFCSSIYYGGPDAYSQPPAAPNPCYTTFNKDGGEDMSGGASRGHWWQGSVYY